MRNYLWCKAYIADSLFYLGNILVAHVASAFHGKFERFLLFTEDRTPEVYTLFLK